MSDQNNQAIIGGLETIDPRDVQSVSAGGVSVTFRDKTQAKKVEWELELEKARAKYNPLFFGNWNDRNMRK